MIPLHTKIKFAVDVIVCALGLIRWQNLGRDTRILAVYFSVSVALSLLQFHLASQRINNLWLMHLFTPIQYAFLAWIFALWQNDHRIRLGLQLSTILFAVLCLSGALFFEDPRAFNIYTKPVESVLLVFFSGQMLYAINKRSLEPLAPQPTLWISAATLIYFSGLAVLYGLSNTLLSQSAETLRSAWIAHTVVGIIANLLYGVAFLCPRPR